MKYRLLTNDSLGLREAQCKGQIDRMPFQNWDKGLSQIRFLKETTVLVCT